MTDRDDSNDISRYLCKIYIGQLMYIPASCKILYAPLKNTVPVAVFPETFIFLIEIVSFHQK